MKRIFMVFIVILFILLSFMGCNKKALETSDVEKINVIIEESQVTMIPEAEITEPAISEESTVTVTPLAEATKAPTNIINESIEKKYSRKPPKANWSGFAYKPLSIENLKPWWGDMYDLTMADLSMLDLTNEYDMLMNVQFDTATIWPEKLPDGFDPLKVMEIGKNPGLGIRSLQEQGITGKGVNIAIIDQPLLISHKEYCDQIRFYADVNSYGDASMHAPFVASISVGKSTGVAPDAGVYFLGSYNFTQKGNSLVIDFTSIDDAIDEVIAINRSLPENQKIRALSMSSVWCPENPGYDEVTEAIERAKNEGIFVISCNMFEYYGFWTYSADKEPLTDPDDPENYKPYEWEPWLSMTSHIPGVIDYYKKIFAEKFDSEFLMIPISSRTYANPTGEDVYTFGRMGGWSLMEPYLVGVYALACQVKPDITPEEFWKVALETGYSREVTKEDKNYPAKLLNPVALIESLEN